jgi:hypothetical protein
MKATDPSIKTFFSSNEIRPRILVRKIPLSILNECINDQFANTGSGQTSGKVESGKGVFLQEQVMRQVGVGEKIAIFAPYIYIYSASFYQDRLGTNIGKTQKQYAFRRAAGRG